MALPEKKFHVFFCDEILPAGAAVPLFLKELTDKSLLTSFSAESHENKN